MDLTFIKLVKYKLYSMC